MRALGCSIAAGQSLFSRYGPTSKRLRTDHSIYIIIAKRKKTFGAQIRNAQIDFAITQYMADKDKQKNRLTLLRALTHSLTQVHVRISGFYFYPMLGRKLMLFNYFGHGQNVSIIALGIPQFVAVF